MCFRFSQRTRRPLCVYDVTTCVRVHCVCECLRSDALADWLFTRVVANAIPAKSCLRIEFGSWVDRCYHRNRSILRTNCESHVLQRRAKTHYYISNRPLADRKAVPCLEHQIINQTISYTEWRKTHFIENTYCFSTIDHDFLNKISEPSL